jgi:hypothetical protein
MPPSSQINVEYFFRLLYELLYGEQGAVNYAGFASFVSHLWLWVTAIGYLVAVAGLFLIAYCTVRLFELRKREAHYYETVIRTPESMHAANARWQHIESLIASTEPSKWREAILEADIMLDQVLFKRGYEGEGVGEKLRNADPTNFRTIKDAGEAHGVRNQIAHQGSAFNISETIARRTIAKYESVFREFEVL